MKLKPKDVVLVKVMNNGEAYHIIGIIEWKHQIFPMWSVQTGDEMWYLFFESDISKIGRL